MHLHTKAFPKYFVLQSLHKALLSTTLHYKACTKHVPVLLCTTKLAQSTSQHYFVLRSLHKADPSTTLYYKACTKHFPVLLCPTKLAQSTSQYDFVLQTDMTTCWTPSKRRGFFAASPIDTATPQENQRLETRHVGAAKRAFRARHPPILTLSAR